MNRERIVEMLSEVSWARVCNRAADLDEAAKAMRTVANGLREIREAGDRALRRDMKLAVLLAERAARKLERRVQ